MKKFKEKIKRSGGEQILFNCFFVFLCIFSATYAIAYFFVIMNTFKDAFEYIVTSKFAFPTKWVWNYGKVFNSFEVNGSGYFQMCFHSIWFSLTGSIPALISTAACSYAYARYKFPGRNMIFAINLIMLTLSLPGSGPAYYKLFCDLGMKNSWRYLFGVFGGFGSQFIILVGFWRGIDWAYGEATFIDGGGDWTVFSKVMMPQALPMLGVFFVLGFINGWNSHEFTMLYMPRYPSIAFGLYEYQARMQRTMDTPMYFSALVVTSIPSIILYISFQDLILQNLTAGALKG